MKKETNHNKVKIIPLGGLEQIGMNMTAFEYEDSIIVVDCGMAFPSDDMLGIDLVIPDVSYLKNNIDKVKGFVITHGHEDHIGALPYVLRDVPAPVYGTKLTIGLIENKLKEHNMIERPSAQGRKQRTVHQSSDVFGLSLSRRTTVSQMHRRLRSSPRLVLSSTPATSRSITHRYSVNRRICSVLPSLEERRAGADVRQYQRDPSGIYDVGAHRRQDL